MQMPLAQGNVNDIDYNCMNNLLIFFLLHRQHSIKVCYVSGLAEDLVRNKNLIQLIWSKQGTSCHVYEQGRSNQRRSNLDL